MNLHVFNDAHGFNLNAVVDKFNERDTLSRNLFINLNSRTIYKNKFTSYLRGTLASYRKKIRKLPPVETVSFYPLDYHAAYFLKELKRLQPSVKVNWVFWSYEFYHQPELYPGHLDAFSSAYYRKKNSLATKFLRKLKAGIKKIAGIPVYNRRLLEESRAGLQGFYSFQPQDYKNIFMSGDKPGCRYYPISFLTIEEMTNNLKKGDGILSGEIMIGHAASPTANHKEIIDKLAEMKIPNNLFIPLEYGEDDYREAIKKVATTRFANKVQFLENRLDMEAYFQRLSRISFAIFNFKSQEALGNILFLVWNGAKVFLREESSVYKQFKDWGLQVYSVDHDLNPQNLDAALTLSAITNNKKKVENLLSATRVSGYWTSLM